MGAQKRCTVVGGGVLGAACALTLTRAGHRTVVVDPGDEGTQTSVGSLAWLNVSSCTDAVYLRLRSRSVRAWDEWRRKDPTLPVAFGGTVSWSEDAEATAAQAAWLTDEGWEAHLLDGSAISAHLPSLRQRPEAALWVPGEGRADPARIAAHLRQAAIAEGATWQRTRVDRLETKGSRITQVIATDGTRIEADHTVLAAGYGSRALLAPLGIDLPLGESPGLLVRTTPVAPISTAVISAPVADFWQASDGTILLVSSQAKGTGPANELMAEEKLASLAALFDGLDGIAPTGHIARSRPMPGDGFPLLGRLPGFEGLLLASCHSGMTLAPVIAEAMACLVDETATPLDLSPYAPLREAWCAAVDA